MNNHTKTQRLALALLRSRLDPKAPLFAGSEEVEAALSGPAKVYFDTYVLPVLDYLIDGEQWHGQAESIRQDHANRVAAVPEQTRWLPDHSKCSDASCMVCVREH